MANDFSSDSRILAVYNMDTGGITVDSKGSNDLTNDGVGVDGVNFKQGDQSASFAETASMGLSIADGDQPSDWPLNDGGATASDTFTICFWIRFDSQPGATNRRIIHKQGGLTLFHRTTDAITVFTDTSHEFFIPSTGQWYHIGWHYNGNMKTSTLQVWDDSAATETLYGITWTGANVANAANDWAIGATDGGSLFAIDGQMDEVVVANQLLRTIDVTKIRSGTFGLPDGTQPRFPVAMIGSGLNASVPRIF